MAAVRVLLLWWACALPLAAQNPDLDKRVSALAEELRCLVCQNQTIADSNAGVAVDLKNQVRERLRKGVIRYKHIGPLTPEVAQKKLQPLVKELNGSS